MKAINGKETDQNRVCLVIISSFLDVIEQLAMSCDNISMTDSSSDDGLNSPIPNIELLDVEAVQEAEPIPHKSSKKMPATHELGDFAKPDVPQLTKIAGNLYFKSCLSLAF